MQRSIKSKIFAAKFQIGAERKSKFFRTQIIRTLNAFVSAMKSRSLHINEYNLFYYDIKSVAKKLTLSVVRSFTWLHKTKKNQEFIKCVLSLRA